MDPLPDHVGAWLSAARGGSREALGRAMQACRRYLLAVANDELHADLRAKGGASDLVQDTFVDAQRSFDRFQGNSEGELRAWLRQLLHSRACKFGRHYRGTQKRRLIREADYPLDGAPAVNRPTPSVEMIAVEQAEHLRAVLARLSDDHRRVITLRYAEGCSFEEVGRRMERTANAARLLWLRAIEQVKRELKGELDEPG